VKTPEENDGLPLRERFRLRHQPTFAVRDRHRHRRLVLDNQGLARMLANRAAYGMALAFGTKELTPLIDQYYRELIDAAMIGLAIAAQRYDPERISFGGKVAAFSTVACWWIRSKLQDAVNCATFRHGNKGKNKRTRPYRVSLLSEVAHGRTKSYGMYGIGTNSQPFDVWDNRQPDDEPEEDIPDELMGAISSVLDARRARAVYLKIVRGYTLDAVGMELGVSKERARQLTVTGLAILRGSPVFCEVLERVACHGRERLSAADFKGTNIATPIA
jgi:RNA polymerase sigma factor (sigma-70 family)